MNRLCKSDDTIEWHFNISNVQPFQKSGSKNGTRQRTAIAPHKVQSFLIQDDFGSN
jgi:hypothetical protein